MNHATLAGEFVKDHERAAWHDATLWFVLAIDAYFKATGDRTLVAGGGDLPDLSPQLL